MQSEAVTFTDIAATPPNFTLRGGRYSFRAIATWNAGSVTLNAIGPDGATPVGVKSVFGTAAALTANGGVDALDLPPGEYQLAIAAATVVYATIARVPS